MPKAVFFDVDGTLVDSSDHQIPQSTLLAIQKLKAKNYKVAIATGRERTGLADVKGMDMHLFDGFVLSNGAAVFDHKFHCISYQAFSDKDIETVLEFSQKNQIGLIFETIGSRFTATDENIYMEKSRTYYHETPAEKKSWNGEPIVKINAFQDKNFDFSELNSKIPMHITPCPIYCYDIVPQGVTKAGGITALMKYWNFEVDDYICFGDHENDREMIKNAKIGVAVKDIRGSIMLQETAEYVCEAAKNDGIYHFLIAQGFIEE